MATIPDGNRHSRRQTAPKMSQIPFCTPFDSFSLAIHKLATNAAKYGALSDETGTVAMSWGRNDGAFFFAWNEAGGPAVTIPTRRGFGSRLIERIVASYFEGEAWIKLDPAGIRFRLKGAPSDVLVAA